MLRVQTTIGLSGVIHSVDESRVIVGECESAQDAFEYIHFKTATGWKVLVPPFPSFQQPNDQQYSWTFILHRF